MIGEVLKEDHAEAKIYSLGASSYKCETWVPALDKLTELIVTGYADVDIELSEIRISVSEYAECRGIELMGAASDLTGMVRDLYNAELSVDMHMINEKLCSMQLVKYTSFTDTGIIIETNRVALAFILLYVEQKEMLRQAKEAEKDER